MSTATKILIVKAYKGNTFLGATELLSSAQKLCAKHLAEVLVEELKFERNYIKNIDIDEEDILKILKNNTEDEEDSFVISGYIEKIYYNYTLLKTDLVS